MPTGIPALKSSTLGPVDDSRFSPAAFGGQPNEFFRYCLKNWWVKKICRQRLQNQNPSEISRQCLENLIDFLNKRFARQCLANSTDDAMDAEYKIALPDEAILAAEIDRTRETLSKHGLLLGEKP